MSQDPNHLARLISITSQALPGFVGRIGPVNANQLLCGSVENPARIASLHGHWQQAHPEAGPHYWSTRSWTLLIWQPVYLSLLAVHLANRAPCLAQMGQSVESGFVGGFCLPEHCPHKGAEETLIRFAAEQINDFTEQQLNEFNSVSSIYPKLARLLVADCVRAALLLVQRQQGLSNAQLRGVERSWMEALGLPGASALIEVCLDDGRACLALSRKACCQHFRRSDGEPCSSCPKLKQDERLRRLRQELLLVC
ncbi:MAG TPA: siderophore ferric iron reductase [Pseudomonas xinjiangensis]|uniref:Siderophore ferric iron reductase n=2 Tax=root TaxID=1 RepID=A0A7V1BPE1_9GAMM|nr:siderophore ferric iron reductase [Halopseudomonas xinjiangensis]HEC46310.1 siderophore ferric iron reductase [Halopseudomonas xinjiangensis]